MIVSCPRCRFQAIEPNAELRRKVHLHGTTMPPKPYGMQAISAVCDQQAQPSRPAREKTSRAGPGWAYRTASVTVMPRAKVRIWSLVRPVESGICTTTVPWSDGNVSQCAPGEVVVLGKVPSVGGSPGR